MKVLSFEVSYSNIVLDDVKRTFKKIMWDRAD